MSFVSSTLEGTKNPNIGRLVKAQARFIDESEAALKKEEQEKLKYLFTCPHFPHENKCVRSDAIGRYLIAVMKPSDDPDAKQLATLKNTMRYVLFCTPADSCGAALVFFLAQF